MKIAVILSLGALALVPSIVDANHTQNSCIDMLGGNADTWFLGFDGLRYYLVMDNGHGTFFYQEANGIEDLQRGGADPCRAPGTPDFLQFYST